MSKPDLTIQLLDRIQMVRGEDDSSVHYECEKAKAIIRRETAKERQRLDALVSATQAVIERWDSPLWKDLPATADYIHKLRNAVGAYQVRSEYSEVEVNPPKLP